MGPRRSLVSSSRGSALGLLALAALVAGCASALAPLTPAGAKSFVLSYDRLNAQANNSLDTALQNKDEEGISARIDDSFFAQARDSGEHSLSGYSKTPRWLVKVSEPGTSRRPAYFYAAVSTPGHPKESMLLVFKYDKSVSSWKVLYEDDLDGNPAPAFSQRPDGRGVSASPTPGVISKLAALWDQYRGTGGSAEGFAKGPLTTGEVTTLRSSVAEQKAAGGTLSYSFSVNATPPTAVAVSGGELLFGAIDQVDRFHPTATSQCTAQNSARSIWNPLVKPGSYRSVRLSLITEVAMVVPSSGPIRVIASYPGAVSASTVSCHQAPTTTE